MKIKKKFAQISISKIFTILAICLMSISIAYALLPETSNYKIYDDETRTVTIYDGDNNKLADIQLLTPLKNHVPVGYVSVAELKFTNTQDSSALYDQMKFYNIKDSMKEINKSFDFMFKESVSVSVNDYGAINISIGKYKTTNETSDYPNNQTNLTQVNLMNYWSDNDSLMCQKNIDTEELYGCSAILGDKSIMVESWEIIGSHMEDQEQWFLFDKLKNKENILAGEYTVGIFTDTILGEEVEWVPAFFGVEIDEWASYLVDGLVSYWTFDESSGNAVDAHGSNNGTINGATQNIAGKINTAYSFDGTNDNVAIGNSENLKIATGTISAWIKLDANQVNPATANIVSKIFAYAISIREIAGEDRLAFYDWGGGGWRETGTEVTSGVWHHVVLTFDASSTAEIWLDGNSLGTFAQSVNNQDTGVGIGAKFDETSEEFTGDIDEVGIWNVVLSNSAIADLYNSGDGFPYPFEEETPPQITLNSPSDNTATINSSLNFNASYSGTNNVSNATLYVWYNNGSLYGTNYTDLSSLETNETSVLRSLGGFLLGNYYKWNYYFCDITNLCNWADLNFTFYRGLRMTTFNNSLTAENLTFTGDENISRNLTIPRYANVSGAFMNLSGITSLPWKLNIDILSGLPNVGSASAPFVFEKLSVNFLISGEQSGVFTGFNWTGSTWQSDTNIVSGLTDVGTKSIPTVFIRDSSYNLISGEGDGFFNGWTWDGSTWQSNSSLISGLGDVGFSSAPTVFELDGIWYLISGSSQAALNGWNWTGSTWQSDTNIVSGLTGYGRQVPRVFEKDLSLYLILGHMGGTFIGFNWTGSTWQSDTNIVSGLTDVGELSSPTIFNINSILYLISGEGFTSGNFTGFSATSYTTSPYIQINNTQIWNHTGEFNSTFSPNKTDDFADVLNSALNSGNCDCTGCSLAGNDCTIEFIFHSDTAGNLEYSAINIQYITPLTITVNITKPDTVYTNTDWLINLTATSLEESYLDSYVQFYINNAKSGNEITFNMTNNINHQVATLSSGTFVKADVLIAEVWISDRTENTTKVNLTSSTVQNSIPTIPSGSTVTSGAINVSNTLTGTGAGSTDADSDAITYHYEFYNNNDTLILQEFSTDNTYVIQSSDAHDLISVRIKATTSDANSTTYEEVNKSISNSIPTVPNLNSPINNTFTNDNTVTFSWDNSTDLDIDNLTYILEVDNDSDFLSTEYSELNIIETTTPTSNTTTALSDNLYYWRVRANDGTVNSSWSEVREITVDTTFPTWASNETNLTESTPQGDAVYFNITLTELNPDNYIFSWYNGTDWENTTNSYTNGEEIEIIKIVNSDIGIINWTWYINDTASNLNQTDVWSITLLPDDTTNPNLIIISPVNNSIIEGSSNISLKFSATDDNLDTCIYNLKKSDGTFEINDFEINCSTNTTFDVSLYDTFTLNMTVNDTSGNLNSSQVNFTVIQPANVTPDSRGGGGATSTFNKTLVCDFAEQFLKEHITLVGFDYSHDDIVNLTTLINIYSRPNIQVSTTELYLKNFEAQCDRTNPVYLKPSVLDLNFTFIKIIDDNLSCSPDIGKKVRVNLGLFSLTYDMDWYVPFFRIDTGQMSCESLEFWGWIFKYEANGEGFYTFKGFKLWWILSSILLIFIFRFFLGKKRENSKINKLIDKKLRR